MQQFPVSLDTLITFVRTIQPKGDDLSHLSDAVRVSDRMDDQADALIGYFVDQARRSGASWSQIGQSMGVSKQAVQKRFVSRSGVASEGGERLFGRFAQRARNSLLAARGIASASATDAPADAPTPVEPRHLVAGLLAEPEGVAARAIAAIGVPTSTVFAALGVPADAVAQASDASPEAVRAVAFSLESRQLIARSLDVALHYGHNYIGTEHLVLSAAAEGPVAEPLASVGLGLDTLQPVVERLLEEIQAAK
ncbi:Clp protease N-terminal domain-containing protein [Humibacter sp. RRB41]|uniref:Clp protease N-terminal domain-containing protein n=1 Tax=Humibacter sp. RRB41 TaxID=2919946 RepID=UPI001FAB020E|nr:Clp protease N-terminal domain-containing protein [Humibacter sp. RRB41]